MKIRSFLKSILLTATALLLLSACGGGGGGDDANANSSNWDDMVWDKGNWK